MESKKRKKVNEGLEVEIGKFELCMTRIGRKQEEFTSFIAHSSKVNNTNQDKIRKLVLDVVDQTMIQSNAINCLSSRVIEQCVNLIEIYVNTHEEVFSYAYATKKTVPRKQSSSRKRDETFTALIYPTTEIDSDETRNLVKNTINSGKIKVCIRKVKKISKG